MFGAFPTLSQDDLRLLEMEVTQGHIFNVVNHMGCFKLPGPDRLQATLLKSQWKVVGGSFCKLVENIFRQPEKVRDINETFITLIPKVENVCKVRNF